MLADSLRFQKLTNAKPETVNSNMEYCIPDKRELRKEEKELLIFLLEKELPELKKNIDNLKVIGKCGCGKCPTILFGLSFEDSPIKNATLVIDYQGKGINGELIGTSLFSSGGIPTELEFYSLDGMNEIIGLPLLETVTPLTN